MDTKELLKEINNRLNSYALSNERNTRPGLYQPLEKAKEKILELEKENKKLKAIIEEQVSWLQEKQNSFIKEIF